MSMNLDGGGGGGDKTSLGLGCLPALHLSLNHDVGNFLTSVAPQPLYGCSLHLGTLGRESCSLALASSSPLSPRERPRTSYLQAGVCSTTK